MIVLGTYGDSELLCIAPKQLLHHTLIVGQSGSGKSFFVARLFEEILSRTQARVVVLDPNGDFRSAWRPEEAERDDSIWETCADKFRTVDELCQQQNIESLEQPDAFRTAWESRRFQHVIAASRQPDWPSTPRVAAASLFLHWEFLRDEQQFLLDMHSQSGGKSGKLWLGTRACHEFLRQQVELGELPNGFGLLEVIRTADKFLRRDISLQHFPYAKDLTAEDWSSVLALLSQLFHSYRIWWRQPAVGWEGSTESKRRFTDLSGYLDRPFDNRSRPDLWDACVIGLESARMADSLLAADVAIARLWRSVKYAWMRAMKNDSPDSRKPTFVVIDEAHNFAPKDSDDLLQQRVTSKLIQIAAEGRKYGLYLILATQRPRKLHPSLVLECENFSLLRVQSRLEHDFAEKEFRIPNQHVQRIADFGLGQALLHGRWVGGMSRFATISPARITVGGGGLPKDWMHAPSRIPIIATSSTGFEPSAPDALFRDIAMKIVDEESVSAVITGDGILKLLTDFPEFRDGDDWIGCGSFAALINKIVSASCGKLRIISPPPNISISVTISEDDLPSLQQENEITTDVDSNDSDSNATPTQ